MKPFLADPDVQLYHGDALAVLRELPDESVHACVTSPPYLNARPEYPSPTLDEFQSIFRELRRVVTGPALVNVGRTWRGTVERLWWIDLLRACEAAGWHLLDTLVWAKPNANPIHGRVFSDSHEYVLILGSPTCGFNVDAIRQPYTDESKARMARRWVNGRGVKGDERGDQDGRPTNLLGARPRSFVTFSVGKAKGNSHPAPMAEQLADHLVLLGSWPSETVLDPFAGSGTTLLAARKLGRNSIGIDSDERYLEMASRRLAQQSLFAVET